MAPDTPNDFVLSPSNCELSAGELAAKYVAHRYCLPLSFAAIVAASAGIGGRDA